MELTLLHLTLLFLFGTIVGFGTGIYYFKKKMESKMEEMMGGVNELFNTENEGGMFD